MLEVNCETDFVTKNDSFLALANAAAALVAQHNPVDVVALSALPHAQDGFGPTLEDVRKGLIGKIGENMTFRRFVREGAETQVASYLHGTRIGVLVAFEGDRTAAKDVAMHVMALAPQAIRKEDLDPAVVDKEREILSEAARKEGKPENIIAKMIEGRLRNFFSQCVLLEQPFVKDDKQTVGQFAKSAGLEVKSVENWKLGG
jgi:elongation factor Ts